MRTFITLGIITASAVISLSAKAGSLSDYKAKPANFTMENGVRVFRAKPAPTVITYNPALENSQSAIQAAAIRETQRAFERGYDKGFKAGQEVARKDQKKSKRHHRRNRYNYGRRYSTSFYNPRYSRFRGNASYGRPAYIVRVKRKKRR